ncbi:MAG: FxsA family protein [Paracoccaceae bacterium]
MWLFLVFVIVPVVEIALFISLGGLIGLWPTVALILLTAILGTSIMRAQGLAVLGRLQSAFSKGGNPTGPIAEGAMILIAGLLLLTPGFLTDSVGFALLVPIVRTGVIGRVSAALLARGHGGFQQSAAAPETDDRAGTIVEGEFTVNSGSDRPENDNSSGWTRP